ncbi:ribosome maturation factor RimP [Peptostreptococcus anaerobius CAG:621]|uniref:ribosome maturation factor RimP n=1 Tax=Peptostreptococcus anaerobius TaxID=1261 RepID=UPI0003394B0C|nr:ribosome maturation factor RimP [Peptostreptococcus anaerobius]CCY50149.1 ribosome maturation factor RimP [Peptostreptococcus anaerobius CAG:621]
MKKNIAQQVEKLVQPIADLHGFELVDVEYVKEAGIYYLRVIIDSEDGIGLDECEKVSRDLNPILDEKDMIEENYLLEVCSPGIDRILKRDHEYEKYSGKLVEVKLYANNDIVKGKRFEADLCGLEDDNIVLLYKGKELKLNRKEVAQVRLAVVF